MKTEQREQLHRLFDRELDKVSKTGFYGSVSLVLTVQDGMLQVVTERVQTIKPADLISVATAG